MGGKNPHTWVIISCLAGAFAEVRSEAQSSQDLNQALGHGLQASPAAAYLTVALRCPHLVSVESKPKGLDFPNGLLHTFQ